MIFYFANRYIQLVAVICAVYFVTTSQINCQALYAVIEFMGYASTGLASINLSIRTISIWAQNRYIVGGLVLVILGHWSLILQGFQPQVSWLPGVQCIPVKEDKKIVAAIFIYSMCFDFMVLLLNTYKLLSASSSMLGGKRSIARLMFFDGLIFFLTTFLCNFIATILLILNLNPIIGHIFNFPACVLSTISACRAVRGVKINNGTDSLSVLSILHSRAPKQSPQSDSPPIQFLDPHRQPWEVFGPIYIDTQIQTYEQV